MGQTCSSVVVCTGQLPPTKEDRKKAKAKARKAKKKAKKVASNVPSEESLMTASIPTLSSTGNLGDVESDDSMAERRNKIKKERRERQNAKMAEMNNKRAQNLEFHKAKEEQEASALSQKKPDRSQTTPIPAPRTKREKFRPSPTPRKGVDKNDMAIVDMEEEYAVPVTEPVYASTATPQPKMPSKLKLEDQEKGDVPFPAYRFLRKEKEARVRDTAMPGNTLSTHGGLKSNISSTMDGAKRETQGGGKKMVGTTKVSPREVPARDDTAVSIKAASARISSSVRPKAADKNPGSKAVSANDPFLENESSEEDVTSPIDSQLGRRATLTDVGGVHGAYTTSVIGTRKTRKGPLDPATRAACMDAYVSGTISVNRDPFSPWRNPANGYIEDGRVLSYNAGTISRSRPDHIENAPPVHVNRQIIKEFENEVDHLIAVHTAEGEGVTIRNPNRSIRNVRGIGPISRLADPNRPVMPTQNAPRMRSQRPNLTVHGITTTSTECLDLFAKRCKETSPRPRP